MKPKRTPRSCDSCGHQNNGSVTLKKCSFCEETLLMTDEDSFNHNNVGNVFSKKEFVNKQYRRSSKSSAFAENQTVRIRGSSFPRQKTIREFRGNYSLDRRRAKSHCNNHNTDHVNWADLEKKELVNVVTSMNINELLRNIVEDPVVSAEGYKKWSLNEYVLQRKDRRIFVGGQGFVLFVRRKQHSSSLAMKVCLHNTAESRIERYKMKSALQVRAAKESKFVSDLLVYYITDHFFVSVMYKAKHASLKMLKREIGEFPSNYISYYASCIIDATYRLHKLNITHKDIKADNVLIDHLGVPQLADFGLANENKKNREMYSNNKRVTSMQYYPPESLILGGKLNDFKIDTWLYGFFLAEIVIPSNTHMWTKFTNSIGDHWTFALCSECNITNLDPQLHKMMKLILRQDPTQRPHISEIIRHPYFDDINWRSIQQLPGEELHVKNLIANGKKGDQSEK